MTDEQLTIAAAELDGWNHWFNGWNKREDNSPPLTFTQQLPPYLTSTDAALRLVEKLKAEGWVIGLDNFNGDWEVDLHNCGRRISESADSLPRAITLACLRAAGKLT